MKTFGTFRKDQNGATAVEFALTAPVYFMIMATIMWLGVMFWYQTGIQNGATAAARCAGIKRAECLTDDAIKTYAISNSMGLSLNSDMYTITRETCGVRVKATYTFDRLKGLGIDNAKVTGEACYPT